mgnify:CR=1 FL=1
MAKINGNLIVTAKTTTGSFEVGGLADLYGPIIAHSTLTLNADPTLALQAATKQYVDSIKTYTDTQLSQKLNLSGGTLTGPLILASNPTDNLGAATKQYVDSMSSSGGTSVTSIPTGGGTANEPFFTSLISNDSTPTNVYLKPLSRGPGINFYDTGSNIYISNRPYIKPPSVTDSGTILRYELDPSKSRNWYISPPPDITGNRSIDFSILIGNPVTDFDTRADLQLDINEGVTISCIIDNSTGFLGSINTIYAYNLYNAGINYTASPNPSLIYLELLMTRISSGLVAGHRITVKSVEEYDTGAIDNFGPNFNFRRSTTTEKLTSYNYVDTFNPLDVIINYDYINYTNVFKSINAPLTLVLKNIADIEIPKSCDIVLYNIGTLPLTIVPASGVTVVTDSSLTIYQNQRVILRRYEDNFWVLTNHNGYADTKLSATGGTLTGNLFLNGDPASPTQAATKNYVDTGLALKANKAGDTFTGPVILAANPTTSLQAATKNYVDIAPYAKYYDLKATFVNGGIAVDAADANVVYITVPQSGNLSFYSLLGNGGPSGCSVDVWKVPYASFPPSVTNSITGGNYPTISGTSSASDGTLSGWTVSVSTGDIIGIKLRTNGLFTSIFFTLRVTL